MGQTFPTKAALGETLFFDPRLSGDSAVSCSTCHMPDKAWTDGQALANGYTSTGYFRNTPTLLNASKQQTLDWDGRFSGEDMDSAIRDHLAEAHFMRLDGRLMVERMKQVPEYDEAFIDLYGNEVSFGKVLDALGKFVATLESQHHPYFRFQAGDDGALSEQAQRGLALFEGKAGCSACHSGDLLSDGDFHATGVPANPEVFSDPARHISFRRFFKQFGVGDFVQLREDVGRFALTHEEEDRGRFRTPSLLEVARTAPYMHNGVFEDLEEVVRFYNDGGGEASHGDPLLQPLGLTEDEIGDLVAFLESLRSPEAPFEAPDPPKYAPRELVVN